MPDLPKIMFLLSCSVAVFFYGLVVGRYEIFPFSIISKANDTIKQVIAEKDTLLRLRPSEFMSPARYKGNGVTRAQRDKMEPGLTFLTGFFKDTNEMRLVRSDGSVVHRWPVKYFKLFTDQKYIQPANTIPNGEWNLAVHGSHILPDGSVIFNFTYYGTAKLDRCGKVLWTIPRMTHHAINPTGDGGFWIPSIRYIRDKPGYPHLQAPYNEDTLMKVSADGKVVKEISILDILFKNNLEGMVYRKVVTGDLTHVNDVEELTPQMAASFPQFAAGDLLLSLRVEDLVLVVNPETLLVKWYQQGPWIGQHDPDFMLNGRISMFSNNEDGTVTGSKFGGSTIMEVDPQTRRVWTRYGGKPGQEMYTLDRGKHQRIGKNILITEARSGRIIEVNAEGEVVWEYINRYDDANILTLTGATRYPENYFTVSDWSCPGKQ